MTNKSYLGDSVYVDYDGYNLVLTTENGLPSDPSNIIYLEGPVWDALQRYVERLQRDPHEEATNGN